ncbi:DUF899 domain-containing protein [Acuticoccus sediminis]|uniref:DUF899 domain-containing protein n=1 Tax=Acuticoccus sediminis TaxID=2184697 RepID=UPI001CFE5F3C|nr:thioredoxin family protein [Acuticoccus sediminis]
MHHPKGTREEWLTARLALLDAEKDLTRRSDQVALQRRSLPWVRVDRDYRFETEDGSLSLRDLFGGRSQLLVYHFMFGPDYAAGCPSCSAIADGFNGIVVHLQHHDVAFWAVSSAPLAKLEGFRRRMGWTFPWASSGGSAFNTDFQVTFTEEEQRDGIRYNYRDEPPVAASAPSIPTRTTPTVPASNAEISGTDPATYARERPGTSAFVLEDGDVYHTYSTYARGVDSLWAVYQWLDRAPLGRNEPGGWLRHRDAYGG